MQIEVARPFWLDGQPRAIGDVLDVPDGLAAELIGQRKAVGHVPAPAEDKPRRSRKQDAAPTEPAVEA